MNEGTDSLPDRMDAAVAAQQIWRLYRQAGGATFNLFYGNLAGRSLYAVSVYSDRTRDVNETALDRNMVEAYIRANLDLLALPENSIGLWLAADEGKVYLDVSITVADRQRALYLARQHGEQAICHLSDMRDCIERSSRC